MFNNVFKDNNVNRCSSPTIVILDSDDELEANDNDDQVEIVDLTDDVVNVEDHVNSVNNVESIMNHGNESMPTDATTDAEASEDDATDSIDEDESDKDKERSLMDAEIEDAPIYWSRQSRTKFPTAREFYLQFGTEEDCCRFMTQYGIYYGEQTAILCGGDSGSPMYLEQSRREARWRCNGIVIDPGTGENCCNGKEQSVRQDSFSAIVGFLSATYWLFFIIGVLVLCHAELLLNLLAVIVRPYPKSYANGIKLCKKISRSVIAELVVSMQTVILLS
ncbi:MAG: hypothetical protein EXX96DRAFT_590851 [Benjaminiella poitrasii]|nr:MAG: hypothetical protein EXX96DRAFT_590851 [Benjaminiella poitrasii]